MEESFNSLQYENLVQNDKKQSIITVALFVMKKKHQIKKYLMMAD